MSIQNEVESGKPHSSRTCTKCAQTLPLEDFPRCGKGKRFRRNACRRCNTRRSWDWRKANPERARPIYLKQLERAKRARALVSMQEAARCGVDAIRRALTEKPPVLALETETLAYFRGFIAGAKRGAEEGERFERIKDLCHRIASEYSRKRGGFFSYEDYLSYAYEGALNFLRKKGSYEDAAHERKTAAMAIRSYIIDNLRADSEFGRKGNRRFVRGFGEAAEESSLTGELIGKEEDVDIDLRAKLEALGEDHPRLKQILEGRLQGKTLKEIGAELGVTESRTQQIIAHAEPMLREHFAGLA